MAYSKKEIDVIFNLICDRIIEGESVKSILRDKDMPSSKTFWKWLSESEEKVNQYARAKEIYAESVFEEILDIADEGSRDKKVLEDGREVVDNEIVQRSRLRVDARKWMLSKMNPKKYGDKVETTIQGGNNPISVITKEEVKRINESLESDY